MNKWAVNRYVIIHESPETLSLLFCCICALRTETTERPHFHHWEDASVTLSVTVSSENRLSLCLWIVATSQNQFLSLHVCLKHEQHLWDQILCVFTAGKSKTWWFIENTETVCERNGPRRPSAQIWAAEPVFKPLSCSSVWLMDPGAEGCSRKHLQDRNVWVSIFSSSVGGSVVNPTRTASLQRILWRGIYWACARRTSFFQCSGVKPQSLAPGSFIRRQKDCKMVCNASTYAPVCIR